MTLQSVYPAEERRKLREALRVLGGSNDVAQPGSLDAYLGLLAHLRASGVVPEDRY